MHFDNLDFKFKKKLENNIFLLLLILCFVSRLSSSIFYFEDIDSIRFAMAAVEFDVLNSRPHFPGYPIFCFISQLFLKITKNLGFTFSIIGSISTFLILYYSYKIWNLIFKESSLFFIYFLFFNPFLWLMSNRYMPDLLGLSMIYAGLYYFLKIKNMNDSKKYFIYLGIIISVICGIRISYLPFLLPTIILISNKKFRFLILSFFLTSLIWLTPFLYLSGIDEIISLFKNDSYGHFYNWGGTIISSESSILKRLQIMISFMFIDGFSFWSPFRHWSTIINSVFLILFILFSIKSFKYFFNKKNYLIIICALIYAIWVLLFQNIQYKPRHLMPFIPLICILLAKGALKLKSKIKFNNLIILIFLIFHTFITINIINQHTNQSAISQIYSFLNDKKDDKIIVLSDDLKIFYWTKHSNLSNIKYFSFKNLHKKLDEKKIHEKTKIYSTNKIQIQGFAISEIINFYHNPHVNRLWSTLTLYEYEKN